MVQIVYYDLGFYVRLRERKRKVYKLQLIEKFQPVSSPDESSVVATET